MAYNLGFGLISKEEGLKMITRSRKSWKDGVIIFNCLVGLKRNEKTY